MNLFDLTSRTPPLPWSEGDNIPWSEPGFSERMLKEHLSQDHDAASRRSDKIERHVAWIHTALLAGQPARVLDLGCGPGFYASRLARLGHACQGIDFSPASIRYARQTLQGQDLACAYELVDIRAADFGSGYDLVMLIFGELNVFKPSDARLLLQKMQAALRPGGQLLLEVSSYDSIFRMGQAGSSWSAQPAGLFSALPHLVLEEMFWDETARAVTRRFFVIDAASGAVTRHAASYQAYTNEAYEQLLCAAGFDEIRFFPALGEEDDALLPTDLIAITALKG